MKITKIDKKIFLERFTTLLCDFSGKKAKKDIWMTWQKSTRNKTPICKSWAKDGQFLDKYLQNPTHVSPIPL